MCRGVEFSFADSTRGQNKVDNAKESLGKAVGVSVIVESYYEHLHILLPAIDRKRLYESLKWWQCLGMYGFSCTLHVLLYPRNRIYSLAK